MVLNCVRPITQQAVYWTAGGITGNGELGFVSGEEAFERLLHPRKAAGA